MFEPTEDECKKAVELGITVDKKSGPQLREEIRRVELRAKGVSIPEPLKEMALHFGVDIRTTDYPAPLKRRIVARIETLLAERGFTPDATFEIDPTHTCYGGCRGRVRVATVHWTNRNPMIYVSIPAKPNVLRINVRTILEFGRLVE